MSTLTIHVNKMFKLKYNALALVQIFFGLFNSILLLKIFGVSIYTDAYFMGDIILGAVVMAQMMAVEQFMYFYNELKAESRESAHALYAYALCLSLVIGAVSFAAINVFSTPLIMIFAYKLDPARLEVLKRLFPVFSLLAILNPLNFLNAKLLNAEGRFAYPYVLGIIPSLFSACSMAYLYFSGGSDIIMLLAASVAGNAVAGLLGLWAVKSSGVPVRFAVSHPSGGEFVSNSLKVKFGHNINNILTPMVTNNMLSAFSPGAVSYFGYAWKIVGVIGSLATGPSSRIFASGISIAWPLRNSGEIKAMTGEFLRLITPLFCLSAFLSYAALPYALELVSSSRLSGQDIAAIRMMFLALAAWYLTGLVEGPFLQICIASKRSRVIILNNSAFIAVYFFTSWVGKGALGIYSIPFGLVAAQSLSFLLYYYRASKMMNSFGPAKSGAGS